MIGLSKHRDLCHHQNAAMAVAASTEEAAGNGRSDRTSVRSPTMNRKLARITVVLVAVTSLLGTSLVTQAADDNNGKDWRPLVETTGLDVEPGCHCVPARWRDAVHRFSWGEEPDGMGLGDPRTGVDALWCLCSRHSHEPNGVGRRRVYVLLGCGVVLRVPAANVAGLSHLFDRSVCRWMDRQYRRRCPALCGKCERTGTTPVSVSGSFSVVTTASPDVVDFNRGVFLWRPTGVKVIDALSDYVRTSSKEAWSPLCKCLGE